VLFRSAAAAYNSRVIGIVLSGLLEDGTAGMIAIKKCGGTCIVQDPEEAEYPDMPLSVLNTVEVEYCVPLSEMGPILSEKTKNGLPAETEVPEDIKTEAGIAERVAIGIELTERLGERSVYSCPDCSGALFEISEDNSLRYRCHIGHAYTENELLNGQQRALESTLWIAVRMMEERRSLLAKMSEEEKSKGWKQSAESKEERAKELEEHIERLKQLLFASAQRN